MKLMKKLIIIFLLSINVSIIYSQTRSILDYLPSNYVHNGTVDYTIYIQKYLDENQKVLFPNFPVLINDQGLKLKSKHEIIFQKESKLILKPSSKGRYALLHIIGLNDVTLRNVNLEGDRYSHKGTLGEWGMGIEIRDSKNITIQDPKISRFWGDGIYIAGKKTNNIFINGGLVKNNRRNGISIISGDNIHLKNILIEDTKKGVYPMSAIDIEPNSYEKDYLGKIFLENIVSRNNLRGISIVLSNYLSENPSSIDITVTGFRSSDDEIGVKVNPFTNKKIKSKKIVQLTGQIQFQNIQINRSSREPIMIKGYNEEYSLGPKFVFKNISVDKNINLDNKFKKLNTSKFYLMKN